MILDLILKCIATIAFWAHLLTEGVNKPFARVVHTISTGVLSGVLGFLFVRAIAVLFS